MKANLNAPRNVAVVLALALGCLAYPAAAANDGTKKAAKPYRVYESPKGASLRIQYAPTRNSGDRLDRGILRESPRATASRIPRAPGAAPDKLDRGLMAQSPKAVASEMPRLAGASPDLLDRTPLESVPLVRPAESGSRLEARR